MCVLCAGWALSGKSLWGLLSFLSGKYIFGIVFNAAECKFPASPQFRRELLLWDFHTNLYWFGLDFLQAFFLGGKCTRSPYCTTEVLCFRQLWTKTSFGLFLTCALPPEEKSGAVSNYREDCNAARVEFSAQHSKKKDCECARPTKKATRCFPSSYCFDAFWSWQYAACCCLQLAFFIGVVSLLVGALLVSYSGKCIWYLVLMCLPGWMVLVYIRKMNGTGAKIRLGKKR